MELAIEKDLKAERASSLGRTGEALEKAMAAWRAEPASAPARREAQRRLWYLVVQREALGLYRHREVYEIYAVPRGWWY